MLFPSIFICILLRLCFALVCICVKMIMQRKCNSEAIGGIVERKLIKEWLVCGRKDSTNRMMYKDEVHCIGWRER